MPIYEYRCECGKKLEALVRSGREPSTCDEAMDRYQSCEGQGKLVRLLSTISIGRSGGSSGGGGAYEGGEATCGSCGMAPGSCDVDN